MRACLGKDDTPRVCALISTLHPSPPAGDDPKDCPRDLARGEALARGCNSAASPDSYGHYRESKYCAIKHHWWWKSAFVFGQLRAIASYTGPVLFLEEDHVVAPDALHVLHQAAAAIPTHCPDCAFITLGVWCGVW